MIKQLSSSKKVEYLPVLYNRQRGKCFYCRESFELLEDAIFDHLNNNRLDNRLENLCLTHQKCNIKKATYVDYQIMANEQLKRNEDQVLSERKNIEDRTPSDASTEIQINQANYSIVEQFITERVNTDGRIEYSDALHGSTYKCKSITGHGSTQSVRGYIGILTSFVSPLMITKDEKTRKKFIVRRTGQ
ncbi:MAG: HNH endonuclease [Nitrosotalea sp.]